MHPSWGVVRQCFKYEFSYNLSRKYPFKWFKGATIAGFILLFGFFTVFNLATNGYDLQPKYTTDPNSTLAEKDWFNSRFFTWGEDRLKPKCQEQDMPVGYQFITTNMGLSYTLKAISSPSEGSNETKQHPSFSYLNNTLQNCQVKSIDILLRKADRSLPARSYWWSWMFSSAAAEAECEIINAAGLFVIRFGVSYATLAESYDYVVIDDYRTRASVWWGTRLLNNYFNGIQTVMSKVSIGSPTEEPSVTNGHLGYVAGENGSIKDHKLFDLWYYFLASDGSIINQNNDGGDLDQLYNNEDFQWSRPITEGLSFAKIFSSLILVDLGEVHSPNLLLDPELLQYVLDPSDNFNRADGGPLNNSTGLDWWKHRGISPPGQPVSQSNSIPMNQSYEKFKDQMGSLGTRNASIYSQYLCSIPVRKSLATICLIILVTNFVLLQTAWTILKFAAEQVVSASDPTAMYCEGCITQGQELVNPVAPYHDISSPGRVKSIRRSRSSSTHKLLQDDHPEDRTTG